MGTFHVGHKTKQDQLKKEIRNKTTVEDIINITAKVFNVTSHSITKRQTGRQKKNTPRAISMYLIQEYKDLKLINIAKLFELNNVGSASKSISTIKNKIERGFIKEELVMIKKGLWLMEEA
jgi:chromosomal replication initiation ATPase DnaA